MLIGVSTLAATGYLTVRTNELMERTLQAKQKLNSATAVIVANDRPAAISVPIDASHTEDLGRLFAIAKREGIALSAVDYRIDAEAVAPFLIRQVSVKVVDDYPRAKSFIANVLRGFDHASLQEIRIERSADGADFGMISIRFGFVYQTTTLASQASRP